jgi:hypothetical protein
MRSHGVTIKVGDRSHPNTVEVIAQFPAEIYPEEFAEFFKAMSIRMQKKRQVHGDSWKNDAIAVNAYTFNRGFTQPISMDTFLRAHLREELEEYLEDQNPLELIDLANVCAMLWCRQKGLVKK